MKYIRTKDGIEEANGGEDFIEGKSYFYKSEYRWAYADTYHKVKVKTYAKNGITRIADTIEELCDEFVVKIKTGYLITYYDKKLLTQDAIKNGADVYGAIWTDKGLIYVAKMNDKGEIELL